MTLLTIISFVLVAFSAPAIACSGDGLNMKFYLPLSQALETYSDRGMSVDEYLKKQFPDVDFKPVTVELKITQPSEISHVRTGGSISIVVPKQDAASTVVQIEHLHFFVQAEYTSCTGAGKAPPLDCNKTTAYRELGSYQPGPGVTGVSIRLSRSENKLTLLVVAVQRDTKSGKRQFLLASKTSKGHSCGPEESNIYIQDPFLRDALNRQEYDLKHQSLLRLYNHYNHPQRSSAGRVKKYTLTYAEYLRYIEGGELDSN